MMLKLAAVEGVGGVESERRKFGWPLVAGMVLVLMLAVFGGLRIRSSRQADAIPPVDAAKEDRMRQICVFPQTLHTKDELAVVYAADSTDAHPASSARHVPVLEEPYTPLVEVEAAIGKADRTDGDWMEWKENATDAANTNWYLRMAFDEQKNLKGIAVRTSAKGPDGCKELRIGRRAGDWSETVRKNAECGADCR